MTKGLDRLEAELLARARAADTPHLPDGFTASVMRGARAVAARPARAARMAFLGRFAAACGLAAAGLLMIAAARSATTSDALLTIATQTHGVRILHMMGSL